MTPEFCWKNAILALVQLLLLYQLLHIRIHLLLITYTLIFLGARSRFLSPKHTGENGQLARQDLSAVLLGDIMFPAPFLELFGNTMSWFLWTAVLLYFWVMFERKRIAEHNFRVSRNAVAWIITSILLTNGSLLLVFVMKKWI